MLWKLVCLWKSHNWDKRSLGTYMRVTVNKGMDKCIFTLIVQAINFHWNPIGGIKVIIEAQGQLAVKRGHQFKTYFHNSQWQKYTIS